MKTSRGHFSTEYLSNGRRKWETRGGSLEDTFKALGEWTLVLLGCLGFVGFVLACLLLVYGMILAGLYGIEIISSL